MKQNFLQKSILAVAVTSAMGLSYSAYAAESIAGQKSVDIENVATATYKVGGEDQTPVESNKVTITISDSAAFTLIATNKDDTPDDDYNDKLKVVPEGTVTFTHTLKNDGNLTDTYTLEVTQDGATPSTPNDTKDYVLDPDTKVTYEVYEKGSSSPVSGTKKELTVAELANNPVTLTPTQEAKITIQAKTKGNKGGDTQNLTLSATSEYFKAHEPSKQTLKNVDNSVTKLPLFKIVKRVTEQLELGTPNDTATYTIKVTNEDITYGDDATDVTVIDNLPEGLRLADDPQITISQSSNTPTTASVTTTTDGKGSGTAKDGIKITKLNIAKGETVTITFKVQKDAQETLADSVLNHVAVIDDPDDDPSTPNKIHDSTDPNDPDDTTKNFYPPTDDDDNTDGTDPTTPGGDSTEPLTPTKPKERRLTISNPTTKEVPTTTTTGTEAEHETVIKNTGKQVEGDKPDEVKFTIEDKGDNANVNPKKGPVTIVYDPTPNNPSSGDEKEYTIEPKGDTYDLSDAKPKGHSTPWTGMQPDSAVTIKYNVDSNNAPVDTSETTIVTLIPGGADAPAGGKVEDVTNVKGLKLIKTQAIDKACDGTADAIFAETKLVVQKGECVIYKITAHSEFSAGGPNITDVVISDTIDRFAGRADVQDSTIKLADVPSETAVPTTNQYSAIKDSTKVGGTVTTLQPGKYAALTFAVKTK